VRLTRLHVPGLRPDVAEVRLPEDAAGHVVRVLRLRPGARLVLFDGSGTDFHAEITEIAGGVVRARILDRVDGLPASPLAVTLVQGVARGERMDWTLQKATELGVHRIQPVLTARSVVRLDEHQGTKRLRHWEGVVASACEQCGRSLLPLVEPPVALVQHLARPATGLRLMLHPLGEGSLAETLARGVPANERATLSVELLIGPEGGLDEAETSAARQAGYAGVRLGPRILRTETAGIAALAVLQAMAGDLR
jgi:16S rRNA (uracil1498-N3)-methyltransferase